MSGEDESPDDKPFEASEKKLQDARKKGEIVKSNDLIATGAYAGLTLCLVSVAPLTLSKAGAAMQEMLRNADDVAAQIFAGSGPGVGIGITLAVLGPLALWFALPLFGALGGVLAQRALVFAPNKLAPKLTRISLLSNAKNKFGREGLFEFFKSFIKLAIFASLIGWFLLARLDLLISLAARPVASVITALGTLTAEFMALVLGVSFLIGGVDYLWQKAQHLRKNRMSRQELVDETKSSEGDPHAKQQRRQRAVEIATQQMLAEVPDASVVVVNPVHYAVALKWDQSRPSVPVVVALGVDHVAAAIREKAQEAGVPIHRDPPTARALYATCDLGDEIPREQFRAVAAAIRFAETMRQKARQRPT